MRIFRCDHCGQAVFFENVHCLHCQSALAFLPDRMYVAAITQADTESDAQGASASEPSSQPPAPPAPNTPSDAAADPTGCAPDASACPSAAPRPVLWRRKTDAQDTRRYRLCHNHVAYQACNFAVPADDPNPLCIACRQTRLLPDLTDTANLGRWYRIEVAKRRLFYTLAQLGLVRAQAPGDAPSANPSGTNGPIFEFLADLPGSIPVMTGHSAGVITLNVAEADDDERTRRRIALHEPYRTLLGHLRHESGHYYWDRLVREQGRVDTFKELFGDPELDYEQALQRHYAEGPPADWAERHVSAYATSHPWEDWAETWAHYLHMVDLLETAAAYQTQVTVPGAAAPALARIRNPFARSEPDFDTLVAQWVPVTLMVNSLNRSLGQNDAYPFALSATALTKLRWVHDVVYAQDAPL
jgi:hypothetical protein